MLPVFFDYASKQSGLGAWACVIDFPHGPEVFGGLLQGNVSERRALNETMNVLMGLDISLATLYTDCLDLTRRPCLPPGYELCWVSRDSPMHRRAHDQAIVLRERYESLRRVLRVSQLAPLTDPSGTPHAGRHRPLHTEGLARPDPDRALPPPEAAPEPAPEVPALPAEVPAPAAEVPAPPATRPVTPPRHPATTHVTRSLSLSGADTTVTNYAAAALRDLPAPGDLIVLRTGNQLIFLARAPDMNVLRRAVTLRAHWSRQTPDVLGELGFAPHCAALSGAVEQFVSSGRGRLHVRRDEDPHRHAARMLA